MTDKTWIVYWHDQPVSLSTEEYTELRALALDDPVRANEKAREYWERQQTPPEMPPGDDPRPGQLLETMKKSWWPWPRK